MVQFPSALPMDPKTTDTVTHNDITVIKGSDKAPSEKKRKICGLSDGLFSFLLSAEGLSCKRGEIWEWTDFRGASALKQCAVACSETSRADSKRKGYKFQPAGNCRRIIK